MKQFSKEEVATNGKTKENTLIILHDKVYNVNSFLNEHPGGEEILLDHAGKDSSEDFNDVGHSKDAFEMMDKFLVGEIQESERSNQKPKQGWETNLTKTTNKKDDQGTSLMVLIAVIAAFVAILYFVYL
ncbi:cytochrome b5 [Ptiloglossa arizonensis]|uniref:cytochrome b5 n=1 Tax=Ptiloglossa arizonensis TaxID=3350558 RepID=UPI003FA0DA15